MGVIFATIVIIILVCISVIHFYWSMGGVWGLDQSLPQSANGQRLFTPKNMHSAVVAIGMLIAVIFVLIKVKLISIPLPNLILNYGLWLFAAVFMVRAVGDFKYVGFFKRVKQTNFGQLDTKYYSPLCLLVGILMVLIETMN